MDNIIDYFIEEPDREFHIRELAKLCRKSPTTVSKYLSDLRKDGYIRSRKKLNHILFRANAENQVFRNTKLAYNIEKIRKSGLLDYLIDEFNHPEAIVLFGSFRKAENTPLSDIDILIVMPSKSHTNTEKFEKKIGHRIQVFQHSRKEIDAMKTKNKELLNSFINGIVIYGFWEVFR